MLSKLFKLVTPKKKQAVKAGAMLGGESVITEFSKSKKGFQTHEGFIEQGALPLKQKYMYPFMGANRDISLFIYAWQDLTSILDRKKTGSTYGYYKQFIKKDEFKDKKSALIASVGLSKRVDAISKNESNFILCHAVPSKSHPTVNVEVWTVTNKKVVAIRSYKGLPKHRNAFLSEFYDALDNYKLGMSTVNHNAYIYSDSVLGLDDIDTWPSLLRDRLFQLPESELLKSAVELPLLDTTRKNTKASVGVVVLTAISILAGPAFVFVADKLYSNRFQSERQKYIALSEQVDGLDNQGRNSSQVAIWEARDTHLRQQAAKKLDTDNLEILVRAVGSAASQYPSRIVVKTVDYSRETKSRNNLPPYHFSLELLIMKSSLMEEGESIDVVYRALGSALADVTDEFITPGNPREYISKGRYYYRVEFVGRFSERRMRDEVSNG
ncbi:MULTISPECIES: hypothetical protein [Pseudoalteromonas]|uniref:hypothetical protein n=1 Tax=Pseudoalteromonas TaxID=53246 RepID=UPI001020D4A2|nr:hypothetical protein [Pseudoalteromonas sp. MEBiC 03485]RZD19636.1 hypothetical protein EVU92_20765 [Pseudoalteromonas sp. MEBiC 03485]